MEHGKENPFRLFGFRCRRCSLQRDSFCQGVLMEIVIPVLAVLFLVLFTAGLFALKIEVEENEVQNVP